MKNLLNQQLIDKYILDEFGKILNPPTKNEIIELINNNKLTLEKVKLWSLFGGDLMIKDDDNDGDTILHSASIMGQLDIIEFMLDKGVNVDSTSLNSSNWTSLLIASEFGNIKLINLLLDRGANINHQKKYNYSALHIACVWNRLEAVKVLVERGIDVYLKTDDDKTALDVAKNKKIIDYLIPLYYK